MHYDYTDKFDMLAGVFHIHVHFALR